MLIFPAIDLQKGQCVRLTKGDFAAVTVYETDPLAQASRFVQAGASWLHIVDLDGAKNESLQQVDTIKAITGTTPLKVQVGGGIRKEADVRNLLEAGAERVIIGSLAVTQPALVGGWISQLGGERIVLALDVRLNEAGEPEVLTKGWQEGSALTLWDVLDAYKDTGLKTILCTDVQRDGMLTGANSDLYARIQKKRPDLQIIASGGVSDAADLRKLAAQGLYGAIVGKAYYEGKIDLGAVISELQA